MSSEICLLPQSANTSTTFNAQVRAVKLRRDRISVALEQKVLVYDFADLKLLHNIETLGNPGGLLALSAAAENTVLACPGLNLGQVGSSSATALALGVGTMTSATVNCIKKKFGFIPGFNFACHACLSELTLQPSL